MASGIEIAGIVLGSIPLILAGLQFYGQGIEITHRYLKYENEVKTIHSELGAEQAIYQNSINILLIGVVSKQDLAEFLREPTEPRWKDTKLESRLKERLGISYSTYMETLDRMLKIVVAFKEKLKLDENGKPQFSQQGAFRKNYKRLRFSLTKAAYAELMGQLQHANQTLYRLTSQATYMEDHRFGIKQKRSIIPNFSVIRKQAKSLHWAMGNGWSCSCQVNHCVHLLLTDFTEESWDESSESDDEILKEPFHVLFCFDDPHSGTVRPTKHDPWTWANADVRIEHESKKLEPSLKPGIQTPRSVRFSKKKLGKVVCAALQPHQSLKPIQDLCSAMSTLKTLQRDVVLSLLAQKVVQQKYGVHIYPAKQLPPDVDMWSVLSLRTILQSPDFARQDRLKLAVTLAISCLQLHETPWLTNNWDKDNILFIKSPDKTLYDQPFVSHRVDHRSSLINPSLMSMIIRNQCLYALGVALIELWYGKTLSELHKDVDGPKNIGDLQVDPMTEWKTADRIVDDLYSDAGVKYSDAVRRCVRCDFDRRASSFEDAQFQKAVYEGVVTQLKENYEFLFLNSLP